MKILSTLSICFISLCSFAQKTYLIKQNYPAGKKYDYAINSDQIITQKVNGKELSFIQNIGTDYTFDITQGKNGDKNIKVTYKRINLKSVGMGNEMIVDSDEEDPGKPNPFKGLRNASFEMVLAENGAIRTVKGVEKMVDSMAAKMTTDTAQLNQLKISLAKQFNAQVIRQTMESSFKIYPERPVKIGDSWTLNTNVKVTMPIESATTYTLKEVKDNIATLSIKGTLISKGEFDNMGTKMFTDLKGINMGDAQLDIETGIILTSHIRSEMYGKMKTADQQIDFDMEGINKITGKKIN